MRSGGGKQKSGVTGEEGEKMGIAKRRSGKRESEG